MLNQYNSRIKENAPAATEAGNQEYHVTSLPLTQLGINDMDALVGHAINHSEISDEQRSSKASPATPNGLTPVHLDQAQMVSGFGQFHTNEHDPNNLSKKLTPYLTITWPQIITMVEAPPSVTKDKGQ